MLEIIIKYGDLHLYLAVILAIFIALVMYIFPFIVQSNDKLKNIFKTNKLLHPNIIGNYRRYGGIPVAIMYQTSIYIFPNKILWIASILIFVILAMTDYWDGKFARICDLESAEGQEKDPLDDKWFILPILNILVFNIEPALLSITITYTVCDIAGQKIRGKYTQSKAKRIGKLKTTIMFMLCFFYIFTPYYIEIYNYFNMNEIIIYGNILALILAFTSMFQKTYLWNIRIQKALGN